MCAAMHPAQPAHASKQGKPQQYQPRLKAVLEHLESHPMQLASLPMIYAPDEAVQVPLPAVARGLGAADVVGQDGAPHFATTILALVDVAFGALDAAHNKVTPLSWGSPTEYGGAPVRGSPAAQEAAYVHALVHRWEGVHDGEFGSGFSNANYWYRAAGRHPVLATLQPRALELAGGNPKLERFVGGPSLDPTRLVLLCAEAQQRGADPEVTAFANKVINLEWRLLLDWCVKKAAEQHA